MKRLIAYNDNDFYTNIIELKDKQIEIMDFLFKNYDKWYDTYENYQYYLEEIDYNDNNQLYISYFFRDTDSDPIFEEYRENIILPKNVQNNLEEYFNIDISEY